MQPVAMQVRAALGASYEYREKWDGKLPPIDRPEGVTLENYDEEAEKDLPKDVIRYA